MWQFLLGCYVGILLCLGLFCMKTGKPWFIYLYLPFYPIVILGWVLLVFINSVYDVGKLTYGLFVPKYN